MKQSGLMKRIQSEIDTIQDVVARTEKQFILDMLQITLHESGWGYKRVKEFTDLLSKNYEKYHIALEGKMESDVYQEKLDNALGQLVKDNQPLLPFEDRYQEIKRYGYNKPVKGVQPIGWKEGSP